jgi:hypothetical protein
MAEYFQYVEKHEVLLSSTVLQVFFLFFLKEKLIVGTDSESRHLATVTELGGEKWRIYIFIGT